MVNQEDKKKALNRLNTAKKRFESAGENLPDNIRQHPGTVLTSSQRRIEQCSKSIFLLMGVQSPEEHAIPVESENTRMLLNAVYDELDEIAAQKTARLIFLSEVWGSAYPVSEYGVQVDKGVMEADEFLDEMEASQAYNHADEALTLARQIINRSYEQ